MSDESLRAEYLKIKAPEQLYERIMNAGPTEEKNTVVIPFRKIVAMAAALAVIIATGFMLTTVNTVPAVYMGNERLTGEITLTQAENDGIMLARMGNEVSCEMTLELKRDTTVELTQGLLLSQSGEVLLAEGEKSVFSDDLFCKWVVPAADEETTYSVGLSDKKGTYLINLYFDKQTGNWTVCLTK